jgi:Zn ribbon nucleic-acid-binding protein
MAIDLSVDVPVINNRSELKQWLKPMYIISDYMSDYDTYKKFQQKMYNLIKGCFVIKECREYPVRFKFNKRDSETYELQLRHFVVNLIVWYPFIELNDIDVLNKSFILDCFNDIPAIETYINEKLISTLREYHVKSTKVNYAISEVLYNLRKISEDFSIILGLNFSAPTFIDMYNNNPEIKELMECTFEENMQPHEIEQKLQEYEDKEIGIFKNTKDNPIGTILRAQTGIKLKQLREFTISEGLKPTLTGETIPIPIQNSTMLRGLDRPSYLFIDAMGARK